MLRLLLSWHEQHEVVDSPLRLSSHASWYSEASLPSPFHARYQHDPLAEARTRADGIVGHFDIGHGNKTGCILRVDAEQFVVLEAKIFSKLSAGVTNAPNYDQVARNIACIADLCRQAGRSPSTMDDIGFMVIAPATQISAGVFHPEITLESVNAKVQQRVSQYAGAKDGWYAEWFQPLLACIRIQVVSWESLIEAVRPEDVNAYRELHQFYANCLSHNAG